MPESKPSVLTYHSQQIGGHDTSNNDHVALQQDLEFLHRAGIRIRSLSVLVDWLAGRDSRDMTGTVCLSFDDGCDFDVRDLEYPGVGIQRSFLGIMQDFIARNGPEAQPELHATCFVIASAAARRVIDARSLFGKNWMRDDWWSDASADELLSLGNHGWDHNHPDLAPGAGGRGDSPPSMTPFSANNRWSRQHGISSRKPAPGLTCSPIRSENRVTLSAMSIFRSKRNNTGAGLLSAPNPGR